MPGVRREDVDPAVLCDDERGHRVDRRAIGDVGRDGERVDAPASRRLAAVDSASSASRSQITTRAPSAPSTDAIPRPMPRAAPVTIAT